MNYSDAHLDDARSALKRLYTALQSVKPATVKIDWLNVHAARFKAAMDEDFGTPEAVAVLFELATEVNKTGSAESAGLLKALGGCLGLLQGDPSAWLQWRRGAKLSASAKAVASATADLTTSSTVDQMIEQRTEAKKAKNFAEADRIRQALLAEGIVLKDSPTGTTWESAP